jgi:hypothetical protein
MQNGIAIDNPIAHGRIVWTTDNQSLLAQLYSGVYYYGGHHYVSSISKTGSTNIWQLCIGNTQISTDYQCVQQTGSGIVERGINTSIFAETNAETRGWVSTRIDGNFKVTNFVSLRNGYQYVWQNVHRHTVHSCYAGSWPVFYNPTTKVGAVEGSPINNGAVKMRKKGLPSRSTPPFGVNC